MKKILSIVVACVLILTMLVPSVAMASVDYSYIKVKLASIGSPTSIAFKVAGAYRIVEASSVDLFPGITYTIKVDGTGQKLTYNNGASDVSVALPAKVTFKQYTNGSTTNFLYINNPDSNYGWLYYPGDMAFIRESDGGTAHLTLVNTLFMETYLYSAVANEMSDDWPIEALKAQAICSRTYAMNFIKARSSQLYHVVDTHLNQVYKGYPFKYHSTAVMQNVINAVDATRGKAIVLGTPSKLTFADGVFSATNGGQVRTASMKWSSSPNTYHVFKEDPYDLKNPASPSFTYIFPVQTDTATMSKLSVSDKAKADAMLALVKGKLPAALLAQKGVTCTAANVTINGIKSAVPSAQRTGVPAASKEYTKVTITVSVTVATPAPAAGVLGNGVAIASGDSTPVSTDNTDFGSVKLAGGAISKTYTIQNTGNAALNISGITMIGTNAADFTIKTPVPTTVAAGASATFTVAFAPSAAGSRTAVVNIASNDAHSPYTFAIKGKALSDKKNITSFRFQNLVATGTISGTNIAVSVPYGTNVKGLVATFATDGASVLVGNVVQTSGVTANDFSSPVTYTVTAQDGSTRNYAVKVTVLAKSKTASAPAAANKASLSVVPADQPAQPQESVARLSVPSSVQSGGGAMPANPTYTVTLDLNYISASSSGAYSVLGELRAKPFTDYSSLLDISVYLWDMYKSTSTDGKFLYITTRGYGHGVGMSQRGAQEMAREGKTWVNIIDFYFNTSAGKSSVTTVALTQKALSKLPGNSSKVYGKVLATALYMRAAASPKGIVVGTLTKSTIIEILSTNGTWYKVLYASKGMVGYVSAIYIKKTTTTPTASPTPTPTPTPSPTPTSTSKSQLGRVLVTSLYMRSQAKQTASVIYTLKKSDTVTILDKNAATNWYKVKYGSYVGYCMYQNGTAKYIEVIGTTPTPTPTATAGVITVKAITAKANVEDTLTLRASASTSATKVTSIPKGSSFTVLQVATTSSWLKASYSGKTGYVLAKYAIIGGSSAYRACTVTVSQLNVRSGAGSTFGVIGILKSGNTVVVTTKITNSSGTWYKIVCGSVTGYIDSKYARISTN